MDDFLFALWIYFFFCKSHRHIQSHPFRIEEFSLGRSIGDTRIESLLRLATSFARFSIDEPTIRICLFANFKGNLFVTHTQTHTRTNQRPRTEKNAIESRKCIWKGDVKMATRNIMQSECICRANSYFVVFFFLAATRIWVHLGAAWLWSGILRSEFRQMKHIIIANEKYSIGVWSEHSKNTTYRQQLPFGTGK